MTSMTKRKLKQKPKLYTRCYNSQPTQPRLTNCPSESKEPQESPTKPIKPHAKPNAYPQSRTDTIDTIKLHTQYVCQSTDI